MKKKSLGKKKSVKKAIAKKSAAKKTARTKAAKRVAKKAFAKDIQKDFKRTPAKAPAKETPTATLLQVGQKAPMFNLPTDAGTNVSLKSFAGKTVVLYFYPKDDTPGCTKESCDFRDSFSRVQAKGAIVLGVSKDSVASHQKFKEKYSL